ncbi:MAG: hypothetical protein EXS05_21885 [Planctomycetaceae bacterium]|nr:hypothetical protein [Planctomycetaceae bacterium]
MPTPRKPTAGFWIWLAALPPRICWHSFGAVTTAVFMIGALSATKGNSTIPDIPWWMWIAISAVAFAGVLRYARWCGETVIVSLAGQVAFAGVLRYARWYRS